MTPGSVAFRQLARRKHRDVPAFVEGTAGVIGDQRARWRALRRIGRAVAVLSHDSPHAFQRPRLPERRACCPSEHGYADRGPRHRRAKESRIHERPVIAPPLWFLPTPENARSRRKLAHAI